MAYVDNRQAPTKNLLLRAGANAPIVIDRGAISDARLSRSALVWRKGGETWGCVLGRPATRLQVAPEEFGPVPIDTPEGPWVLNYTQTGLILRPFGESQGYRLDNGGQAYFPDGVYVNGAIWVAFTDDAGRITEHAFPLTALRIDLRQPMSAPAPPPPPPPSSPEPPMSDVPNYESLVKLIALPLQELGRLDDIAESSRAQWGEDAPQTQAAEQAANQVKGACCQTIVAALNAHEGSQDWGLLRKDAGQHWTRTDGVNCSTDIAFNRRLLRLVDVMSDRGPTWGVGPATDPNIDVNKWVAPLAGAPTSANPPPPDPPPANPPTPPIDLTDVLKRLAAAEARIAALEHAEADLLDQIHQLDATTLKVGALAGYAKKGDPVTASAAAPFGLGKVVAHGSIDR